MTQPEFEDEVDRLPAALRAALDDELAAGNRIIGVEHGFPAPPVGVCIRMERPIGGAVPRAAVHACRFPAWDGSEGLSDPAGQFFVLGPPRPAPAPLPMDELRAASRPSVASEPEPAPALRRFVASMEMTREKWIDGAGYDLDALRAAGPTEREAIEALLLERGAAEVRDVEALAALDSSAARAVLDRALRSGDASVRMAVLRCAPEVGSAEQRTAALVSALRHAGFYGGLTQALDLAAEWHPEPVVAAVLRGAIDREGEVAVHLAALAMFLHGVASEPFDLELRPFFLRFHTEDRSERAAAFTELCRRIGVDPAAWLPPGSGSLLVRD